MVSASGSPTCVGATLDRAFMRQAHAWFGSRAPSGQVTRAPAGSQAVIASVLRTAIQHDLDPIETLATIRTTGHIPDQLVDAIGPSP